MDDFVGAVNAWVLACRHDLLSKTLYWVWIRIMPDSRLRAAAYAAGVGSVLATPVLTIIVWRGWSTVVASHPNWLAAVAMGVYFVLVVVCTYLTRRGVNLGRGLL